MTIAENAFESLLEYAQDMIDFNKAEMDAATDDSLEFYLAAGAHNAWVLIPGLAQITRSRMLAK
jgi:hypothetical protein